MHQPVLFRQSEINDPYAYYRQYLDQHPVWFDAPNKLWILYGYNDCTSLLHHPQAYIPQPAEPEKGTYNNEAQLLLRFLIRLGNPPRHAAHREIAMELFKVFQPSPTGQLLEKLLKGINLHVPLDWVCTVSKRLPALQLVDGFGFTPQQQETILGYLPALVQIMLPAKSEEQVKEINEAAQILYPIVSQHIGSHEKLTINASSNPAGDPAHTMQIATANLLGLLIQSYDAGNGLLSHALLQALATQQNDHHQTFQEHKYVHRFITETLRYRAPNHHTRRLLQAPVQLKGQVLPQGAMVVLVLAAANRDPNQFIRPEQFDPYRNNNDHIAFGTGAHACIARHIIVPLAADMLTWIFARYRRIELYDQTIEFEPLIHVRLPRKIIVKLTT
ncbi:cytochrome P450 [Paraflavitalea sp. CAU 1676]|uniref:cytochrome P450 n=1 Tax=Paraflavitalea sp. CAU 1676 TaxID=3032598 RepID=UPI0023DC3560|nr:cytochrome P450 [Paraflavitalea sp. CAU 1676]MDF2190411.1 cytochrome P450 [Paraflavitalea sp. CAU 1676]